MEAVIALGIWMVVVGMIQVQDLLKPRQFGEILGLTERTVRDWIAARRIEVIKIGASVRIPASEVERLIREGRRPALVRHIGTPHERRVEVVRDGTPLPVRERQEEAP